MKVLKNILSSFVIALAMTASSHVSAAEAMKPAEAIEVAVSKTQAALDALKAGASAEEVNKLIRAAADATGEIYSNYKTDKARDTAINKLKALRAKVKEGKNAEAEEGLNNSIKEIGSLKDLI